MSDNAGTEKLIRTFLILGIVFLVTLMLIYGASIFVPLAIALLVWFFINAAADAFQRLRLGPLQLPRSLSLLLSFALIVVIGFFVVDLVVSNLSAISANIGSFQTSLNPWIDKLAEWAGVSSKDVLNQIFDRIGIETLLSRIVSSMAGFASQIGVIFVYVIFMLEEQQFFNVKLRAIIRNEERRNMIRSVLERIAKDIQGYMWIMTLVSALTAILSYFVMLWIGVGQPGFWAFLIFVLNFIPTIGSILGTALPVTYALVQFQEAGPVLTLLVLVGAIQFLIGNLLQPRLAGRSLNMSQFVVILSLFVWGAIWGVTGMFLAVPLTSIVMIVLSNFDSTRQVAMMISQDGQIERADRPARKRDGSDS